MTNSVTIPRDVPQDSALSYEFLRAAGIQHIQQLVSARWTDHNTHDPGITILEQLCYAITDLSYRLDRDVKELLGTNTGSSYQDLYSPATIFTGNPVTLQDIRKMVMDVPGVKNAWVEKVSSAQPAIFFQEAGTEDETPEVTLKGLYRVVIERNDATDVGGIALLNNVKARLQAARGVGEDFEEIRLLDPQLIRLQGTVEVGQVDDIDEFVANLLMRVASYISPQISFYTLQQRLQQGKRVEDIFNGPALIHGFIDDDELLLARRKQELHTSDIIREIMDEPAALAVSDLAMATGNTQEDWVLPLDRVKVPKLDVEATLFSMTFMRQGLKTTIQTDRVKELFAEKRKNVRQFNELPLAQRDIVLPETDDQELETYYSIQHQFPANYGIGNYGLPDSASDKRKAQAKQLRAYLMFFEQTLANYFSQAAHFKDLMSFAGDDPRSYFYQSLMGQVPGLEDIVTSPKSYEAYLQELRADSATGLARKDKFLNHLLARFSETFADYGMLQQDPKASLPYYLAKKLMTDKSRFLKDYPTLSGGRGRAFNYKQPAWNNDNIAGLESRIARKLGIDQDGHRSLGDGDTEGFHMIEHLLLRPRTKDTESINALRYLILTSPVTILEAIENTQQVRCEVPAHALQTGDVMVITGTTHYNGAYTVEVLTEDQIAITVPFTESESGRWMPQDGADPYSLQLTFLFPDWVTRYQDETFKQFVEKTVREETPAHLVVYLQWVSKPLMQQVDEAYQQFLTTLMQA